MVIYPREATTFKSINKFTYDTYLNISINMLKYQNDSSLSFRTLSAFIESMQEAAFNVPYLIKFNFEYTDFSQIDRFNTFFLKTLKDKQIFGANTFIGAIEGYSKYTNITYDMNRVDDLDEFIKHSYPCDVFIEKAITGVQDKFSIEISPGTSGNIRKYLTKENLINANHINIKNTKITLRIVGSFNKEFIEDNPPNINLFISGININNELITEKIPVLTFMEFVTLFEYSAIRDITLTGISCPLVIEISPYIARHTEIWENLVVDREGLDDYKAVLSVDKIKKTLDIGILKPNIIDFPILFYPYREVKLDNISEQEKILDYYIDQDSGLLYVLTDGGTLFDISDIPLPIISIDPGGIVPFGYAPTIEIKITNGMKADIYYTLDGQVPNKNSIRYTDPFKLTQSCTLNVVAFDKYDRPSLMVSETYFIDARIPDIKLTLANYLENETHVYPIGELIFNVESTNALTFEWQIDDGEIIQENYSKLPQSQIVVFTGIDGRHSIKAWAKIVNKSEPFIYEFDVDTNLPVVFIDPMNPPITNKPIQVTISGNDIKKDGFASGLLKLQYKKNNDPVWADYSSRLLINETCVLHARAIDLATNASVAISSNLLFDFIAPVISSFEGDPVIDQANYPVDIRATDAIGISGYMLSESSIPPNIDSNLWKEITPTTIFKSSDLANPVEYLFSTPGKKTLYLHVKDIAGNVASKSITTTVDTELPNGIIATGMTITNNQEIVISGTSSDIDSGVDKLYFSEDGTNWEEIT